MRMLMATVAALWLCAVAAEASDEERLYAVEGAGLAECSKYTKAKSDKTTDFYVFAGWVDGYLTVINKTTDDTYDITPWESLETLTLLLDFHCKKQPDERFSVAVSRLVQGLYADRLKRRSEVVKVEVDARGAIVYREVVRRMQEALAQEDYYGGPSDGNFQVETSEALKKFQKAKDLDVSGLPDQKTLHLLLRKSDKQSTH